MQFKQIVMVYSIAVVCTTQSAYAAEATYPFVNHRQALSRLMTVSPSSQDQILSKFTYDDHIGIMKLLVDSIKIEGDHVKAENERERRTLNYWLRQKKQRAMALTLPIINHIADFRLIYFTAALYLSKL